MKYLDKLTLVAAVSLCAMVPAAAQDADVALAPPGCDYGMPHANAPEELSQFDFLIGDYTITGHAWLGTGWSPPRPGAPPSRWNGRYILGGMAIEDDWYQVDPGIDPETPRGINVRMWDTKAGEWDMMWVHTATNQVQDLRAKMIDGKLTMWQEYPQRPNFRAYFERLGPDSWHRVTLAKDENGEWVKQIRLLATRIPCPE
ncbi:hypothetical protein [Pontixanthobacter sp. CEM42]|uniref:hypothetical protein n=1 Tax=Pontixanthobacter sp. CEM42 TaxID=2792077 RepID=UPI001ADFEB91|nr:hypothetical protein [Pontixanthobacter sp. CEM42]